MLRLPLFLDDAEDRRLRMRRGLVLVVVAEDEAWIAMIEMMMMIDDVVTMLFCCRLLRFAIPLFATVCDHH